MTILGLDYGDPAPNSAESLLLRDKLITREVASLLSAHIDSKIWVNLLNWCGAGRGVSGLFNIF